MRTRLVTVSALAVAGLIASPLAARASTPLPDSPCTIRVPAKINVGSPVAAVVTTCPQGALADSVYWELEHSDGGSLSFSRDGGALYPTAGLKNTYGVSAPGTYEISPTASTTFCDADYSECFEIPLYANTVVAKYRTSAALQATRTSAKGRWTTKLSAQVKQYDRYGSDPAPGVVVRIYRDGKLVKAAVTNAAGAVSATIADAKGAHTYQVMTVEKATMWASTSAALRK